MIECKAERVIDIPGYLGELALEMENAGAAIRLRLRQEPQALHGRRLRHLLDRVYGPLRPHQTCSPAKESCELLEGFLRMRSGTLPGGPMRGLPTGTSQRSMRPRPPWRPKAGRLPCRARPLHGSCAGRGRYRHVPRVRVSRLGLRTIAESSCVIVLPGWEKSTGCHWEFTVVYPLGKPVFQYPELTPVELPGGRG